LKPYRSRLALSSSRVILALGGLGVVWLVLAGLFVVHLEVRESNYDIGGNAPLKAAQPPDVVVLSSHIGLANSPPSLAGHALDLEPGYTAPPSSPEDPENEETERPGLSVLKGTQSSLLSVSDEPVWKELAALFETLELNKLEVSFDTSVYEYASALVHRMNNRGEPYLAQFYHPDPSIARQRALAAHMFLVDKGLHPWLLKVFSASGAENVTVQGL